MDIPSLIILVLIRFTLVSILLKRTLLQRSVVEWLITWRFLIVTVTWITINILCYSSTLVAIIIIIAILLILDWSKTLSLCAQRCLTLNWLRTLNHWRKTSLNKMLWIFYLYLIWSVALQVKIIYMSQIVAFIFWIKWILLMWERNKRIRVVGKILLL